MSLRITQKRYIELGRNWYVLRQETPYAQPHATFVLDVSARRAWNCFIALTFFSGSDFLYQLNQGIQCIFILSRTFFRPGNIGVDGDRVPDSHRVTARMRICTCDAADESSMG